MVLRRRSGWCSSKPRCLPWLTVWRNGSRCRSGRRPSSRKNRESRGADLFRIAGLHGLREQISLRIVRRNAAARRHCSRAGARSEAPLMDELFGSASDALTREKMNAELQRIWLAGRKTVVSSPTVDRRGGCLGRDRVIVMSACPGPHHPRTCRQPATTSHRRRNLRPSQTRQDRARRDPRALEGATRQDRHPARTSALSDLVGALRREGAVAPPPCPAGLMPGSAWPALCCPAADLEGVGRRAPGADLYPAGARRCVCGAVERHRGLSWRARLGYSLPLWSTFSNALLGFLIGASFGLVIGSLDGGISPGRDCADALCVRAAKPSQGRDRATGRHLVRLLATAQRWHCVPARVLPDAGGAWGASPVCARPTSSGSS